MRRPDHAPCFLLAQPGVRALEVVNLRHGDRRVSSEVAGSTLSTTRSNSQASAWRTSHSRPLGVSPPPGGG